MLANILFGEGFVSPNDTSVDVGQKIAAKSISMYGGKYKHLINKKGEFDQYNTPKLLSTTQVVKTVDGKKSKVDLDECEQEVEALGRIVAIQDTMLKSKIDLVAMYKKQDEYNEEPIVTGKQIGKAHV